MLEDRLLLWRLRRGDAEALQHIYERYKNDLLGLAIALSGDRATGEDVVHDVFVTFAGRARTSARKRRALRQRWWDTRGRAKFRLVPATGSGPRHPRRRRASDRAGSS